jgi:hypothetical protein
MDAADSAFLARADALLKRHWGFGRLKDFQAAVM